ncbi:MAG: SurA N-terminal domain-containing protein [Bacteroidales bacterium]|nr:SurA N-terminal domain-containing protein [Bacteroidales bacterium]
MAVLEKIRVKFGVAITVIIAIALLSFIIDPSTLSSVTYSMSSRNDVGKIDGKRIGYQEFQETLDTYNKLNEIITGSSASSDEQQKSVRDAAWQSLVDDYLFVKNCKKAGLFVSKDEKVELTTGSNLSPIIARDPNFAGENGTFSVDRLVEFVQAVPGDQSGRMKLYWDYLQKAVMTEAYYEKYAALFTKSNLNNVLMAARQIKENNTTADIQYVSVPVGYVRDSTLNVTDAEVEKYYSAHKKNFKVKASRDIDYVVFEVKPSAKDVALAQDKINACYDEFLSSDNLKAFLLRNSDIKYDTKWYGKNELNTIDRKVSAFVDNAAVGKASEIFASDEAFYAVRVLAAKKMPDRIEVKVIPANDAESITPELTAKLDAAEAMTMTQDRMLSGCENLFEARVNAAQFIQSPQYGQLLVKVISKSDPVQKKQVAILSKNIVPGKETYNTYYSQANTLAARAGGSYKGFKAAADSLHLYVQNYDKMPESARSLGTIDGTVEVTRWAFDHKKGDVSNIITVANKAFFVVALKDVHKDGYTPVNEVSAMIKTNLFQEKAAASKAKEVAEKIAGMEDMKAVAEALGAELITKDGVAFASSGAVAVDPVLLGAVASAEVGLISGPAHSNYSVFVYKVLSREEGAFFNEDDAKAMDAQKAQYYSQMIVPVMSEDKVTDNRARFY